MGKPVENNTAHLQIGFSIVRVILKRATTKCQPAVAADEERSKTRFEERTRAHGPH
jgi:hypothetical protein